MRNCLAYHADAMLGALQWEVNESKEMDTGGKGVCGATGDSALGLVGARSY
jgi:hypothetical protein